MHSSLPGLFVVAALIVPAVEPQVSVMPPPPSRTPMTLTGCVDGSPMAEQVMSHESERDSRARIPGTRIPNFARWKGVTIRGGLWPTPNVAAQAGAIDPAQAAIAHQPGGTSSGTGVARPQFRMARLRAVNSACP